MQRQATIRELQEFLFSVDRNFYRDELPLPLRVALGKAVKRLRKDEKVSGQRFERRPKLNNEVGNLSSFLRAIELKPEIADTIPDELPFWSALQNLSREARKARRSNPEIYTAYSNYTEEERSLFTEKLNNLSVQKLSELSKLAPLIFSIQNKQRRQRRRNQRSAPPELDGSNQLDYAKIATQWLEQLLDEEPYNYDSWELKGLVQKVLKRRLKRRKQGIYSSPPQASRLKYAQTSAVDKTMPPNNTATTTPPSRTQRTTDIAPPPIGFLQKTINFFTRS